MTQATPSQICIVAPPGRGESPSLPGWAQEFLEGKLRRAGIPPETVTFLTLSENIVDQLNAKPDLRVIVTLDEAPLAALTDKHSLTKYHLSPLDARPELTCRKVIPTFSPQQQIRQYELGVYIELALRRAKEECESTTYARKLKNFRLNPDLPETFEILAQLRHEPFLSVDIETGRGQINTVGFAWSASDAIAINVLPERARPELYKSLWAAIVLLLEGESRKILQNAIYETLYFARYGVRLNALWHDTMIAQKFLWPELDKGLDNVGRLYTREIYWKDMGRVVSAEGGRKDWGNVRDWPAHYAYNCMDTTGTYEAAFAQQKDLERRGTSAFFYDYLMPQTECAAEMCLRGLPLVPSVQANLRAEYEAKCADLLAGLSEPINPRSSKQKLDLFRRKGYKLPKKKNKATESMQESSDELALKKLRLAHPEDDDIRRLLEYAKLSKALSSYLRTEADPLDGNLRYTMAVCSTETGRWCLPGAAEVLTPQGWQRLDTWDKRTPILQWAQDNMLTWCKEPIKHEFAFNGNLVRAQTRRYASAMTMEHRLPSMKNGRTETCLAVDLLTKQKNIPLSGIKLPAGTDANKELRTRILVMTQADGHYAKSNGQLRWALRFKFKKTRKILRCKKLLRQVGIKFTTAIEHDGATRIYIGVADLPAWLAEFNNKEFGPWLLEHDAVAFIDEIVHWDGNRSSVKCVEYTTCVQVNAEWVSTMAHLAGQAARIVSKFNRANNWTDIYRVYIREEVVTRVHPAETSLLSYSGKVYCPQTESGFFLMRYQGFISVSGNSGHKDPWDRGLNPQTLPKYAKGMISWEGE